MTVKTTTCIRCEGMFDRLPGFKNCIFCGSSIPALDATLAAPVDIFEDLSGPIEFAVDIKNVSRDAVTLDKITSTPDCITTKGFEAGLIGPGETRKTTLIYRRPQQGVPSAKIVLSLQSRIVGAPHEDQLRIPVLPKPEVLPLAPLVVIGTRPEDPTKTTDIEISVAFKNLDVQRLGSAEPLTSTVTHCDLNTADKKLRMSLDLNSLVAGDRQEVRVRIPYTHHPGIETVCSVLLSPILFQQTEIKALTNQERWIPLPFRNIGKDSLTLKRVEISSRDGLSTDKVKTELPLTVPADASKSRSIRLCLKTFGVQPGQYDLCIGVEIENAQPYEVHMGVTVTDPPVSAGVLAIDFGTSNTCAAFFDNGIQIVPINETNVAETYVPSLLSYSPDGELILGLDAQMAGPECIRLLKTKLGSNIMISGKPARELFFLAIREILWIAERRLNQRIRNLVLTNPARFSNSQIRDYGYVIEKLSGKEVSDGKEGLFDPKEKLIDNYFLLDEGSAAAMSLIPAAAASGVTDAQPLEKIKTQGGRIFVFDFGGGTLDMSYVKIEVGDRNSIRLLNMGGLKNFGGQDINRLVAEMYVQEFKFQLVKDRNLLLSPDKKIVIPVTQDELENIAPLLSAQQKASFSNNINLMYDQSTEGDKFKLAGSMDGNPGGGSQAGNDTSRLPRLAAVILQQGGIDIAENTKSYTLHSNDFKDRLKEKLKAASYLMRTIVEKSGDQEQEIDLVLLSGQSCRIPLVKSHIEEAFKGVPITWSGHLKEAVAEGACLYGASKMIFGAWEIANFTGTRSSFGLVKMNTNFQLVFETIVPKGVVFPENGDGHKAPITVDVTKSFSPVTPGGVFKICENFGYSDLVDSSEMELLGAYQLDQQAFAELMNGAVDQPRVMFSLNPEEDVTLSLVCHDGASSERRIRFQTNTGN